MVEPRAPGAGQKAGGSRVLGSVYRETWGSLWPGGDSGEEEQSASSATQMAGPGERELQEDQGSE